LKVEDTLGYSTRAIKERYLRSGLTILMVLLGAMLLTGLNGLGEGFNYNITKQFEGLAPDVITLTPSPVVGGPGDDPDEPDPAPPVELNLQTLKSIERLDGVQEAIPSFRSGLQIEYAGKSQTTSLIGINPQKLIYVLPGLEFVEGDFTDPSDSTGILLGFTVAYPGGLELEPFAEVGNLVCVKTGKQEIVGGVEKVVMEKKCFVVRGVLAETGTVFYDNSISVPLASANNFMDKKNIYDTIFVVVDPEVGNDAVTEEIREVYGEGIGITTPAQIQETIQGFVGSFNIFLSSIGFISLIVGGVGIITTLYTSVTERTKELGTLKALGATNGNIIFLILFEAVIIGVVGASAGLLAGYGLGWILTQYGFGAQFGDLVPIFRVDAMINVWLTAVTLSILAGTYPAWRAGKMTPMEALRRD
jgi:putative ABC transport system permease protein